MTARARVLIVAVTVTVAAATVGVLWYFGGRNQNDWIAITSMETLAEKGVVFEPERNVYVIGTNDGPLALSARVPHERTDYVRFCPRSGLFESDFLAAKFDRLGIYYGGPAKRSLDRIESRVEGGVVYVDPDDVTRGPARGARDPSPPQGAFCSPT